ncbi:hypothetical protein GCM10009541_26870 [Micromonospora gifhornensis]|uniref:Sensor n=1 Tax=Micromonospora gifhornensis TaxID=84594 RepID=A0ABQ4ILB2_9ACTN|nr:hypothetical protein [Micromonospora gifhornensis]GIJ18700.1 hypothetical protein Vgi01_53840 [Micromonospora gifhornensis]
MTVPSYDGALAEFSALRTEIDSRSKYQQQILSLQLTLTTALFGLGLAEPVPLGVLLVIPLTSYLLCARYIGQRSAIRWASKYITEQLSPRVPDGLGWSAWVARNRRPDRLIDWYVPMLICFPGASLLALGWTTRLVFVQDHRSGWATTGLVIVWLAGLFATAGCGYLVHRVFRDRSPTAPSTQ